VSKATKRHCTGTVQSQGGSSNTNYSTLLKCRPSSEMIRCCIIVHCYRTMAPKM